MNHNILSYLIRTLDGSLFTVEDIVLMGITGLICKTRDYLHANAPDISSEEIESILPDLILSRCISELSAHGEWVQYPVGSHPEMKFIILGMMFSGMAAISPKRIRVELLTEHGVLSRESVLLEWTPAIYTEDPFEGSPANRDGEMRAARLFLESCVEMLDALSSTPS